MHFYPELTITLVEAAAARKWPRALSSRESVTLDTIPTTVIEGMAGDQPQALDVLPRSGQRILPPLRSMTMRPSGVKAAFEFMRLVVGPAGASSIAALLHGKISSHERTTVVIASGGNIDPVVLTRALSE